MSPPYTLPKYLKKEPASYPYQTSTQTLQSKLDLAVNAAYNLGRIGNLYYPVSRIRLLAARVYT